MPKILGEQLFHDKEVFFAMGMLNGLLALVSLAVACFCLYKYQQSPAASTLLLVGTIIFGILMVVFGVMFLSGRVNKSEDIHITE